MKKTLAALAVLGAFATAAQAQTNVSIGGVIQANWKSYSIGNSARATQTEYRIDDDYTSRFWLTGTEDLGGGLSALFYVENRLNTDVSNTLGTGNGLSNGDTFLGLKGSWGQVTVGKHSWMGGAGLTAEALSGSGIVAMPSSMWATMSIMNQSGRSFVDYLDGGTRRANSITYRSPVMSGFSAVVGVSTNPAGNEGVVAGTAGTYSDGREYFLSGSYANGPLSANLAYRNYQVEGTTTTSDKQWRLYGFYKLPMGLKLGLIIDRATRDTAAASAARTAWAIPVSYVFGKNTLLANFARAGDMGGVANTGAKMWTLGWDYALSRRTNVGVYYSKLSNDSAAAYQPFAAGLGSLTGSALAAGESAQTIALGIKHTF
ncbi:MAG: porin [Burkholderiales bacterium]|nr:porin [Burkholderiales bacterium]